jgi:hypothetical protein
MRNRLKEHNDLSVNYFKKIEINPFYEIYLKFYHFNLIKLDKKLISKRPKDINHALLVLIKLRCGVFIAKKNQSYDL